MKTKLLPWLIVIAIMSFLVFLALFSKYRLNKNLEPTAIIIKPDAANKEQHRTAVNVSVSRPPADTKLHQTFSRHELPDKYFVPHPDQNTRIAIKNILQRSIAQVQAKPSSTQTTREADVNDN